jgi:hypothetical protein
MLQTLPDFLSTYWIYLVVIVVLGVVLSYFSEKFLGYLKKGLLIFGVIFALIAGYELLTGNSIISLPGRIDKKLSEQPKNPETGRRYYQSYEERYDGALPTDE